MRSGETAKHHEREAPFQSLPLLCAPRRRCAHLMTHFFFFFAFLPLSSFFWSLVAETNFFFFLSKNFIAPQCPGRSYADASIAGRTDIATAASKANFSMRMIVSPECSWRHQRRHGRPLQEMPVKSAHGNAA